MAHPVIGRKHAATSAASLVANVVDLLEDGGSSSSSASEPGGNAGKVLAAVLLGLVAGGRGRLNAGFKGVFEPGEDEVRFPDRLDELVPGGGNFLASGVVSIEVAVVDGEAAVLGGLAEAAVGLARDRLAPTRR